MPRRQRQLWMPTVIRVCQKRRHILLSREDQTCSKSDRSQADKERDLLLAAFRRILHEEVDRDVAGGRLKQD